MKPSGVHSFVHPGVAFDADSDSQIAETNRRSIDYGKQQGSNIRKVKLIVLERIAGSLFAIALVPLNWQLFWLFLGSYLVRAWAMEGVNHRYFAHRAYKANRTVQLILALIGLQAGQRGALWWASRHRDHHKFADTDKDAHSPQTKSFRHAYYGFVYVEDYSTTYLNQIPDFARYPELRWLNRHYLLPLYGVGALLFFAGQFGWLGTQIDGVAALLWGYSLPCFLSMNTTAMVNTFCHLSKLPFGYRRYNTSDASSNRPVIALITLGAGWHNNHHRFAAAGRAGFAWYEVDVTYYLLRLLSAVGLISGLKYQVPAEILEEGGIPSKPL
jgi:stearoyl-CoA desaturase (Delta-9 desaturase)